MLAPKELGGLGNGSLKAMNWGLLLKWLWRFKDQSEALWVQVVKAIHASTRVWPLFPCNTWCGRSLEGALKSG